MDRQHLNMPHQYGSGSGTDNLMPRQGTASNPGMYSALHSMQHANIAAHQLYSQGAEQAHRFDPRPSPMISSLQRSRLSTGSAMHMPGPQQLQPRRVSLLRDIGRAGERDRDMSSSSVTEGYAGLYAQGASSRHMAASSQPTGVSGGFDRSMSILQQTAPQQYQQQHHDQTSHLLPGSIAISSVSIGEAKKDQNVLVMKQDAGVRSAPPARLGPQPELSSVPHPAPIGIQRQPSVSETSAKADSPLLSPGFEQKSKEDLVQAMDKVDRELSKIHAEIARLEKKKTQLEESAKKPAEPEKETSEPQTAEPKHRDLWQIIYADNRKKAETARMVLDGVCPIYDMPLYNQPSDTKVFQDNLKKNEEMRPKLVKFFQHRRKLANIRVKYLSARYDQMMEEWQQKTEKLENNVKRKAKEAKTREFFEKLFPEVRKQREQQERVERVGSRGDTCRSDADFADIVDGLTEQENQLQHMRQLAVVPPMLLDKEDRRVVFINNNGFITDPFEEFKESQQLDSWADHEKATFKEKYVQHPKNFNLIASCIEKKSVADCILYYYLTKKANNYKVLVRKQTLKPRKPKSGRAHASHHHEQSGSSSNSVKDGVDKTDKDGGKKDMECDVEEAKVDRPPSPRMTRARKQTMNWTEEEINLVKEGFGKYGRDFSSISRMVTNKSEQQVKNFYNNYKKKHGLDQLIIDSKKKKTRSRHAALSPDTPVDDDSSTSRKNEQASDKNKLEKIDEVMEEKKKLSKDRTPSPAVTSAKPAVDAVDPLTSTTYRTRRTTAALAAAATQELQDKEASNKRSADKQPSSAEPSEKKPKKGERKTRSQKSSEQARSELAKSEAVKDVVASLSKSSEEKEDASIETSEQKMPEPKPDDVTAKQESEKVVIKESEKAVAETKKAEETKDASKQSAPDLHPLKKSLEDHDSSGTCSADEDARVAQSKTKPHETKHSSSPYGFDDDFNDSPTRIRLERPRHQDLSQNLPMTSTAAPVVTTTVAKSSTNAALDLVSKSTPAVSTSAVIIDARPQSLPPASTSFPLSTAASLPTTSSLTVPGTGMDLSRPSSTPLHGDFSIPANVSVSISRAPLISVYGQAINRPVVPSLPSVVASTVSSAQHVKNINELTYSAGKASAVRNSSSSPAPTSFHPGSVVDLTKDISKSSQRTPSMQEHLEASSAAGVPISRHQYHVTHPMAGSLSKDFQATAAAAAEGPVVSLPTTGYSRVYSEKDKLAMKHRAAVIPDTNVFPVGSLRFPAAAQKPASTQLSASMQHDQYKATVPTTSDQASSKHAPLKEEIQHPVISGQSIQRLVFPAGARLPSSTTPKVSTIPAAAPRASLPLERPGSHSSEKIVPKHVTLSGGSITQGKPVFRAQLTPLQDSLDVKKEKMAAPTRGMVPGAPTLASLPMTSEAAARRAFEAVAAENILAAHSGLLPAFNPVMTQFLPGLPPTVKHEKEPHPLPKAFTPEDLRRSSASPGNPMHLDPQFLMSQLPIESIIQGIPPKGKSLEESLSPKRHGSTPPPSSGKGIERKSSLSSIASTDLSPRRPSPMVHGMEGHYKEDIKRPSSASRLTPERRSMQEKASMVGHHRLSTTAHPLAASKQRNAAEPKLPDDVFGNPAELLALMNPGLFGVPSNVDPMAVKALFSQYKQPGPLPFAPGLHPAFSAAAASALARQFPVVSAENIEKSRHNLLVHDFKTKQQLLQQPGLASLAAVAGAARLPYPVTSLQAAVAAQNQPVSIGIGSAGMPPRHSDSPASLERFNFIPQHGTISSQGSPHRSETPKTPNPQSPSSPHTALKGQIIPGLMGLPHEGLIHTGIERRHSGSPHVPDLRHQPLLASSLKHQSAGKYSHSMPEGLAVQESSLLAHNPFGSTPHLVRQTTSPLPSQRPKSVKQERSADLHHPADPQRRYALSPDQARSFATSYAESNRPSQRWETHAPSTSLESAHKMAPKQAWLGSNMVPSTSDAALKEAAEKQMHVDSSAYPSHMQQERAAKDLKTKGRATITPKLLISTIIDHNINQYAADKTKQKEPEVLPLSHALERKISEGHIKDLKVTEPVEQKRYSVGSKPDKDKSNSYPFTRTTTLYEHSTDIIANMYKGDPTKVSLSDFKPDPSKAKEVGLQASPRFFNVPSNIAATANDDQQSKRTDVTRTNLLLQTFAPQMGDQPLESIIRKALTENQASSSATQSPPITEAVRQNRPDSASGMIAGMRPGSGTPFQPKTSVASFQSGAQEQKRTMEASHFGRNSPAATAPPQMFSALSLRKNPPNCPTQQIPPPSVSIPGRPPVLPVASNAPGGVGTTGVYHQQAPLPPTERAPIPANEYEPLSDDDM